MLVRPACAIDTRAFLAAIRELDASGQFTGMSLSTDEDEHSIEMHLPYVRKVFEG